MKAGGKLERLLIRRVQQQGDRSAANRLTEAYYNEIYAYVYRQIGQKERAMDLTQDIFVSALQSICGFDPDKSSIRTWLYRIASHKVIDWYRSSEHKMEQRRIPLEEHSEAEAALEKLDTAAEETRSVEEQVITGILAGQIFGSLKEREPVLEAIFRLKFYGNATFSEIGKILDLPESTVKSKYYSTLKVLRKEYAE